MPVYVVRKSIRGLRAGECGVCIDTESAHTWLKAWVGGEWVSGTVVVRMTPFPPACGLWALVAGGRPLFRDFANRYCTLGYMPGVIWPTPRFP